MSDSHQFMPEMTQYQLKETTELQTKLFNINFISLTQCRHCFQVWNICSSSELLQHIQICSNINEFMARNHQQDGQAAYVQSDNIYFHQKVPSQIKDQAKLQYQEMHKQKILDSDVEKEIDRIFQIGSISDGTIKQYRGPLKLFYSWLWQKEKRNPNAFDILHYIQNQDVTLHDIQALGRLRKVFKIYLREDQQSMIKQVKLLLKENTKAEPNRSWSIAILQKVFLFSFQFINDLVLNRMDVLAYRIYILYYLGARVSELSQINFQMLCDGLVKYIPKKQQKLGQRAERILEIPDQIKETTKIYMALLRIKGESKLSLGKYKKHVSYDAMQKQLMKALQILILNQKEKSQEYKEFLDQFSYHDLRHSKLSHLFEKGVPLQQIQEFVKHCSQKSTKAYIKSLTSKTFDLNCKIVKERTADEQLYLIFDQALLNERQEMPK